MTSFSKTVTQQKVAKDEPLKKGDPSPRLLTFENGTQACVRIKVEHKAGKRIKCGLPVSSLVYRELAFYNLAKMLGLQHLLPESVYGTYKGREALYCAWVSGKHMRKRYSGLFSATNSLVLKANLRQIKSELGPFQLVEATLLHLVAASRDAHAQNLLVKIPLAKQEPKLYLIDNEASFGLTMLDYYSFLHKYLYWDSLEIPEHLLHRLAQVSTQDLTQALGGLLNDLELDHLYKRIQFVLELTATSLGFETLSQGKPRKDFPDYRWYFGLVEPKARPSIPLQGFYTDVDNTHDGISGDLRVNYSVNVYGG